MRSVSNADNSTPDLEALLADDTLLTLPEVADYLGVPVTRVHDLVGAHKLLMFRRGHDKRIPRLLLDANFELSKFIAGAITVLHDGGFDDDEILAYLYTPDESLPGRPIDALHGHGAREVIRRAQAMAF
ncbi:Rv2175c family DNA-binding protein [Corynebacterium mayonis]|uniref:Rv2175c family DNA-binding protein n=1 Tax=Corynebacterium mayonis TaxID=3062461 RepID=UPI003140C7C4